MRSPWLFVLAAGCMHSADPTVLGRVVIYRNGVAFYERRAQLADGKVSVHVPRDRVDDFLKSLTVVDPTTHKPLAVSIPRSQSSDNTLTMTIETPDRSRADVLMTYVTEAPAWKPSYRVVVGPQGKVMLEGWAIVDNMSGEDWKGVLVGVGASSALAFRYDLWSVHNIDRDLLQSDERFAIAPPAGLSPYTPPAEPEELAKFDAKSSEPASAAVSETTGALRGMISDAKTGEKLAGVTVVVASPALGNAVTQTAVSDDSGAYDLESLPSGTYLVTFYYADLQIQVGDVHVAAHKVTPLYQKVDTSRAGGEVIKIAARAPTIDPTSTTQGVTIDKNYVKNIPTPGRTFEATLGAAAGSQNDGYGASFSGSTSLENQYYVDGVNTTGLTHGTGGGESAHVPSPAELEAARLHDLATAVLQKKKDVILEGDPHRAAELRNKLIDQGIGAAHVRVVAKPGAEVRVLAVAPGSPQDPTAPPRARAANASDAPVGESHFTSDRPMTVRAGSSAMVAMVHAETTGGVVYLYDPIGDRGDKRFAFKAVRLDNPTADTLEPGPITVYGDGRFIGEGITEPVPPHAAVVVPFALDRQIVITSHEDGSDRIAKLVTIERGVARAEVQHRKLTHLTVTSRLDVPAKVYLRHRLESGWTLVDAPPRSLQLGDSRLFEVDVAPHATQEVVIAEATPVDRTIELASDDALAMLKVYLDDPQASPALRAQLETVLATHRAAAEIVDRIATLREQADEYRSREGELHAQLATLRAVRGGGDLILALRSKLADTNDRIQKATIAIVDAQEQLMLLRVKLANQLADLHLTDATAVTKR